MIYILFQQFLLTLSVLISVHLQFNMAFDNSLFQYDAGYYEYLPEFWFPGTLVPNGFFTCSKEAVDEALKVELDDSDVLIATYPKTGNIFKCNLLNE